MLINFGVSRGPVFGPLLLAVGFQFRIDKILLIVDKVSFIFIYVRICKTFLFFSALLICCFPFQHLFNILTIGLNSVIK